VSCGVGRRRSSDPESGPRNGKKTKKKKKKERKKHGRDTVLQISVAGEQGSQKKCMRNLFFREAIEAREQREICKWSERS